MWLTPFQDRLVMAVSKYAYVKGFEQEAKCLPEAWIVVEVDGAHRYGNIILYGWGG